MREDEELPTVNRAVAGDDAVPSDLFLPHVERLGAVDGKGIEFGERPRIDQQLDALPGGQLALWVLLLVRVTAPVHGVVLALAQEIDLPLRG